jgi:hypothetical protein
MNNEEKILKELHDAKDWRTKHEQQDRADFAVRPTKDEMKIIVQEAMTEAIKNTGSTSFRIFMGIGMAAGALTAIVVGAQTMIGLFKH